MEIVDQDKMIMLSSGFEGNLYLRDKPRGNHPFMEQAPKSHLFQTQSHSNSLSGGRSLGSKPNSKERTPVNFGYDLLAAGPREPVCPLFGMSSRPALGGGLPSGHPSGLPTSLHPGFPTVLEGASSEGASHRCALPQPGFFTKNVPDASAGHTRSRWTPSVGGLRKLDWEEQEERTGTASPSPHLHPRDDLTTANALELTLRGSHAREVPPSSLPDCALVSQILQGGEKEVWGLILLLRSMEADMKKANDDKALLEQEREEMSVRLDRMEKEMKRHGNTWVQPQVQKFENQVVVLTGRVLQLQERIRKMSLEKSEMSLQTEHHEKQQPQSSPPSSHKGSGELAPPTTADVSSGRVTAVQVEELHAKPATKSSWSSGQEAFGESRKASGGACRGSREDRLSDEAVMNRKRQREDLCETPRSGASLKVVGDVDLLSEVSRVQRSLKAAIGLAEQLTPQPRAKAGLESFQGSDVKSAHAVAIEMMDHFAETECCLARLGALVSDVGH